jgi:hypothetical protein
MFLEGVMARARDLGDGGSIRRKRLRRRDELTAVDVEERDRVGALREQQRHERCPA